MRGDQRGHPSMTAWLAHVGKYIGYRIYSTKEYIIPVKILKVC